MTQNIRNSIAALSDEITACRRELHQHPQTCYEEVFASDFIAGKLTEWGISFERGWAKTGIIATIKGNKGGDKAIGLRCDIDALDIVENSGQPWASKTPGKMHGCGHDGHTAMLLGAAKYLKENNDFSGVVHLIFQPAEEGGGGAIKMIEEGLFKKHPMAAVYGMHNWPMMKQGSAGVTPGPIMACSDELEITITGKGGHAALPHLCKDPIPAACAIVTALQTIVSRDIAATDPAVVSITNINGGTGADNVIPDTVKMIGTARAFRNETRDIIARRLVDICENIAQAHGVSAQARYIRNYDATINDPAETAHCVDVLNNLLGSAQVDATVDPCMGAEDFGAMLQEVPGCYIWMGQGIGDPSSPHDKGLHNAGYDFNDEIIPLGVEYWVRVVEKALK